MIKFTDPISFKWMYESDNEGGMLLRNEREMGKSYLNSCAEIWGSLSDA
jgi:hypothetical protein